MSNHLSYAKLSPNFRGFIARLNSTEIPKNIQGALDDPKWKDAVMEEMKALIANHTWENVELSPGKKTVGCKWIFTIKQNSMGVLKGIRLDWWPNGLLKPIG